MRIILCGVVHLMIFRFGCWKWVAVSISISCFALADTQSSEPPSWCIVFIIIPIRKKLKTPKFKTSICLHIYNFRAFAIAMTFTCSPRSNSLDLCKWNGPVQDFADKLRLSIFIIIEISKLDYIFLIFQKCCNNHVGRSGIGFS